MITDKPDNVSSDSTGRDLAGTKTRDYSSGPRTTVNVITELYESVAGRTEPSGHV